MSLIFHRGIQQIVDGKANPKWLQLKIGQFTGTSAKVLVTPTGKISKAQGVTDHIFDKAGEVLTNEVQVDPLNSFWASRGIELEREGLDFIAARDNVKMDENICYITNGDWGVSPDDIVSKDGKVTEYYECKCPSRKKHIGYAIDPTSLAKEYFAQCQMALLVCEIDEMTLFSYDPSLPAVVLRVHRDEDYISTLHQALKDACDRRDEVVAKLRKQWAM